MAIAPCLSRRPRRTPNRRCPPPRGALWPRGSERSPPAQRRSGRKAAFRSGYARLGIGQHGRLVKLHRPCAAAVRLAAAGAVDAVASRLGMTGRSVWPWLASAADEGPAIRKPQGQFELSDEHVSNLVYHFGNEAAAARRSLCRSRSARRGGTIAKQVPKRGRWGPQGVGQSDKAVVRHGRARYRSRRHCWHFGGVAAGSVPVATGVAARGPA